MNYILFDLETTCWESDYPVRQREIIEMGALHLGPFGKEVSRFECLIKPEMHPRLSQYCTRLTGITQQDVDDGLSFDRFHSSFSQWLEQIDFDRLFVAWGAADEEIMNDACAWHGLDDPLEGFSYLDVKKAYHEIMGLNRKLGLTKTLRREGLEFEGDHHRAMPDAINLGRLFRKHLGQWPV